MGRATGVHDQRVAPLDGPDDAEVAPADPAGRRGPRSWPERARRWVDAHPLLVVAVLAGVQALASGLWLWHNRRLGGYDPDEAGYLTYALRFQRAIHPSEPLAFWDEVIGSSHAPLVPLLSVVTLVLGVRDPRWAMAVQPVLVVALAVACAGIARRLAGPRWAIVAGIVVCSLRTVVLATQSYWYGLGAATFTALTVWALLSSERGANRRVWLFGVGLGLVLLTRTMVLGFLPAFAVGAVLLAGRDRRRLLRVVGSLAVAAAIAGPWWIRNWDAIFEYLVGYGYGTRANEWGPGGIWERIDFRVSRFRDAGLPGRFVTAAFWGVVAWSIARLVRARGWRPPWTEARREAAVLAAIVAAGIAALLSTRNQGIWFELPLVVLVVPLWIGAAARTPRFVRPLLAVWLVGASIFVPLHMRDVDENHADIALATFDARFGRDRTPAERARAADEWWDMTVQLTDALERITERKRSGAIYMTGNTFLVNTNTVMLAAELDLWDAGVAVIDSRAPADVVARDLTPLSPQYTDEGVQLERVIVVVRQDGALFTPDLDYREVEAAALASGWVEHETFAMPVGGEVVILRHRDNLDADR